MSHKGATMNEKTLSEMTPQELDRQIAKIDLLVRGEKLLDLQAQRKLRLEANSQPSRSCSFLSSMSLVASMISSILLVITLILLLTFSLYSAWLLAVSLCTWSIDDSYNPLWALSSFFLITFMSRLFILTSRGNK
jgi:hypothetical protein